MLTAPSGTHSQSLKSWASSSSSLNFSSSFWWKDLLFLRLLTWWQDFSLLGQGGLVSAPDNCYCLESSALWSHASKLNSLIPILFTVPRSSLSPSPLLFPPSFLSDSNILVSQPHHFQWVLSFASLVCPLTTIATSWFDLFSSLLPLIQWPIIIITLLQYTFNKPAFLSLSTVLIMAKIPSLVKSNFLPYQAGECGWEGTRI